MNKVSTILLITLLAAIMSCNDPSEGLEFTVDGNLFSTVIGVEVVDYNTKNILSDAELTLTFDGEDKGHVYSITGKKNVVMEQGTFQFALERGLEPSPDNPVRVIARISGKGFLDTEFEMELGKDGSHFYSIDLLSIDSLPKEIKYAKKTMATDQSGAATEEVLIAPESTNTEEDAYELKVPVGTVMKDGKGQTVSGSVVAEVVSYDTRSVESKNIVGGAQETSAAKDTAGNDLGKVYFTPMGLMKISMSAGGSKVKQFSTPLELKMEINPAHINLKTGQKIKVGDTLEIWSSEENSSAWKMERLAAVTKNEGTGKLEVKFEVWHLSEYMATQSTSSKEEKVKSDPFCNTSIQVSFSGIAKPLDGQQPLPYALLEHGSNKVIKTGSVIISANQQEFSALLNKESTGYDLVIYNTLKSREVIRKSIAVCSGASINVDASSVGQRVDVLLEGLCSGGEQKRRPTAVVYVRNLGDPIDKERTLGTVKSGKLTTYGFKIGQAYSVRLSLDGTKYEKDVTITSSDYYYSVSLASKDCQ